MWAAHVIPAAGMVFGHLNPGRGGSYRGRESRHNASTSRCAMPKLLLVITGLTGLLAGLLAGVTPAGAATIGEVTGFGTNPGNLRMFRYVPDGLPTGRPLVVALHGCTQTAASYGTNAG